MEFLLNSYQFLSIVSCTQLDHVLPLYFTQNLSNNLTKDTGVKPEPRLVCGWELSQVGDDAI